MKLVYRRCDNDMLTKLLPGFLHLEAGSWIAGGAARCLWFQKPEKIVSENSDSWRQDIDVFSATEGQQNNIRAYIKDKWFTGPESFIDPDMSFGFTPKHNKYVMNTPNATTYVGCSYKGQYTTLQVIQAQYVSLQELFNSFDFYNCQFATNGIWLVATQPAVDSWQHNTLKLNPHYHGEIKIARLLKYCIYGLTPPREMWQEIVAKSLATRKTGWNYDYTS